MRPDRAKERPAELPDPADRTAEIDRLLPQTQCRRCGYDGCRPYAAAMSSGRAAINRCPPGGSATIGALARLLGVAETALDPACGVEQPRRTASVDNNLCIGCTKCILACPVDAIIGAPKHQHHVLGDRCTGCELCLPPCPVDCISMHTLSEAWSEADAARGRDHHRAHLERLSAAAGGPAGPAQTAGRDPLLALAAPAERSRRLQQILERARNAAHR